MRCLEISHRRPGARAAQPRAVNLPEFSALVWIRPRGRGPAAPGAPPPAPGTPQEGRSLPPEMEVGGRGAGKTPFGKQRLLGCGASSELRLVPKGARKKRSENLESRGPPSARGDRDLTIPSRVNPPQVPKRGWSGEGAGEPPPGRV